MRTLFHFDFIIAPIPVDRSHLKQEMKLLKKQIADLHKQANTAYKNNNDKLANELEEKIEELDEEWADLDEQLIEVDSTSEDWDGHHQRTVYTYVFELEFEKTDERKEWFRKWFEDEACVEIHGEIEAELSEGDKHDFCAAPAEIFGLYTVSEDAGTHPAIMARWHKYFIDQGFTCTDVKKVSSRTYEEMVKKLGYDNLREEVK